MKRLKNIELLMQWREEVIEHVFGEKPGRQLLEANRKYYEVHINDGTHIAYVAEMEGKGAGCGSICLTDELPSPDNPTGRCAYLMNIYVREPYRKHGVGHLIVKTLIGEAKERNCGKIYLETTEEGRSLYRSLGFVELEGIMKLENHD